MARVERANRAERRGQPQRQWKAVCCLGGLEVSLLDAVHIAGFPWQRFPISVGAAGGPCCFCWLFRAARLPFDFCREDPDTEAVSCTTARILQSTTEVNSGALSVSWGYDLIPLET